MEKGKFELTLSSVAVIAFGFAALRQPTAVLMVCGYALLAVKDSWLNRQAMQSLLLTVGYYVAALITGWVFGGLARFFLWVRIYKVVSAMNTVNSLAGDTLYLALIGLCLLAILRVLQGRDAGLPLFSLAAGGDLSKAFNKPRDTTHAVAYSPPVSQPAHIPLAEGYAPPIQEPPKQPDNPLQPSPLPEDLTVTEDRCPACSAPLQESSRFCIECGAKVG